MAIMTGSEDVGEMTEVIGLRLWARCTRFRAPIAGKAAALCFSTRTWLPPEIRETTQLPAVLK